MALLRSRRADMPTDAIIMTEDEALKYQIKVMRGWKNKSDTFAFRHGGIILGTANAFVGIYINNYFRMRFKLHSHGRMSSYLPIVALPAALALLCHTEFVTTRIALQKTCLVCTEMRASAIQAFSGCVLPIVLAPLAALPLAMQYHTYEVPYITKEPMKVFRLLQKMSKPIANILMGIFLGQAILGSVVTYFEAQSVYKVNSQLAKLEEDLENKCALK